MLSQTNFYKKCFEEIAGGLAGGLVWGLVWGLVVILINWSEALPFLVGFKPILFLIWGVLVVSEIMFFLTPKEKLKKNVNIFWFTCKRKLENLFEIILVLSAIAIIYILGREAGIYIDDIMKWIGYIGVGIGIIGVGIGILGLVVLVFYVWIKISSLRYKK